MAIYRHSEGLPPEARGAVIAVGNFDGVHLGHQAVIAAARDRAHGLGAALNVLTFEPHPRQVFQPDLPPFRLTPLRIKARALEAVGVDNMIVLHFDLDFSKRSAEAFVDEVLLRDLGACHVVTGWDFRFGHKRGGDAALLEALGAERGFGTTAVAPVAASGGEVYASSRIRAYLKEAAPAKAAALLGRSWEIEGRVDRGRGRGRTLGFPTANIDLGDYLSPAHGIYAVRAGVDAGTETVFADGVGYFGEEPVEPGQRPPFEVHFFADPGDLYGRHLRVQLVDYVRADKRFDGLEPLKAQIAEDCRTARRILEGRDPAAASAAG